jgi:Fe-S oxidoreductase
MKKIGLIDLPKLSTPSIHTRLKALNLKQATPKTLQSLKDTLSAESWDKVILLIPDAFTSFYDASTFEAICRCLLAFGYTPLILPFSPNGKGLHVKGQIKAFKTCATKQLTLLKTLDSWQRPLIAIDPAVALTYRDEYKQVDPNHSLSIHLLQEWLQTQLSTLPIHSLSHLQEQLPPLFGHCTETTALTNSHNLWIQIFAHFGLSLATPQVGCCGMCGAFGHEQNHVEESKGIFEMSWKVQIQDTASTSCILATGYSCRSQVKRYSSVDVLHPLAWLSRFL